MNVLFVYSLESGLSADGLLDLQERIQFGISYISSVLQNHGHYVELAVISRSRGKDYETVLKKCIDEFNPRLICFTAVATEYDFIAVAARFVKNCYPDIFLLIGGVHVTLNAEDVFSSGDFDALCVGEGEAATLELVEQLEKNIRFPSGIPNIWIKNDSLVEKNGPREFLCDLDSLPFPDRKMWQKWMSDKLPERCSILLSRGCHFNCSYCCNHSLRKVSRGSYVRTRTPENIIAEIRQILSDFSTIKEIYLEAETITLSPDWCVKLCSLLEEMNKTLIKPLSFGANIRVIPNTSLEKIFRAFQRANFRFVNIGLESGSARIRVDVLRRNYSNNDIIESVKMARRCGLKVSFFNLIGVPGETLADFKETVNVNRICKPDWHFTSIFFPYPGTDLYYLCKKQGLLEKPLDSKDERRKAVLDLPGFSRKEIQQSLLYFDHYIYDGFDPDDKILIKLFRIKLLLVNSPYRFFSVIYRLLIRVPLFKSFIYPLKDFVKKYTKKHHRSH